jgi:transketolase
MRALPNMKIFSPANPMEARLLTEYLMTTQNPAYLRIGKGGEPAPEDDYIITIGKGLVMRAGGDVTIFSTGSIILEALRASELLSANGISTEVINIHTIKPIDVDIIVDRAKSRKGIFVLEEHNILGGLGSAIAEIICEANLATRLIFKRFGVPDQYNHLAGSQKFMRNCYGLNGKNIAEEILKLYNKA